MTRVTFENVDFEAYADMMRFWRSNTKVHDGCIIEYQGSNKGTVTLIHKAKEVTLQRGIAKKIFEIILQYM